MTLVLYELMNDVTHVTELRTVHPKAARLISDTPLQIRTYRINSTVCRAVNQGIPYKHRCLMLHMRSTNRICAFVPYKRRSSVLLRYLTGCQAASGSGQRRVDVTITCPEFLANITAHTSIKYSPVASGTE